jgi:hypothetical protein
MANLPSRTKVLPIVATLGLGAASGLVASRVGLPLPWMLGPMIGCTVAALAGAPLQAPGGMRRYIVPVIGVFLGSGFSPDMLAQAASWGMTAMFLPIFIAVAAASSYLIYRRFGGYDPITAFFSAMPGGLNEMMILGEEAGGNGRKIALAHATRILIVIAAVAVFFGLVLGVSTTGAARNWTGFAQVGLVDGAALAACALIGLPLATALRLPAAPMFGPMILSAVLHMSGLVTVPPPTLLVIVAQVFIGTIVGCRFVGVTLREVGRDMVLGLASASVMLSVALAFAEALHLTTGRALSQAFLAFSPGGLTEMSLLALTMGQEVAYVASAHIARIMLVIFTTPLLFRALAPRLRDAMRADRK